MQEDVWFSDGHGSRLSGILTVPKKGAPIVIIAHGFASRKESAVNVLVARALSARGIGSFRFDFYGHGDSEGKFEDITLTEGIGDVVAANRFVKKRFPRAKIGLWGVSYGGGASFYAAPRLAVDGIVLVCPAIRYYEQKLRRLGPLRRCWWRLSGRILYRIKWKERKLYFLKYGFLEDLQRYRPEPIAPEIKIPVLFLHGDADRTVRYEESVGIARIMPDARLATFRGTGHNFRTTAERERLIRESVVFFRRVFALDNRAQRI